MWKASFCCLHHRSHESAQSVTAPRLPSVQPQLHHTDLPSRSCPKASWTRVEGQSWGFWWCNLWWGACVPIVWCPLQDAYPAPGAYGHSQQQPGFSQPSHFECGLQQLSISQQHGDCSPCLCHWRHSGRSPSHRLLKYCSTTVTELAAPSPANINLCSQASLEKVDPLSVFCYEHKANE